MIHILNGKNRFKKEIHTIELLKTLDSSYEIKEILIEENDKPNVVQEKLEDLLIKLSMKGLFSRNFCGIILLPQVKKSKKSKEELLVNLLKRAVKYCSEEKQLIIFTPQFLTKDEKKEISSICGPLYHKFIDLEHVSNKKEIHSFTETLISELNLKFTSKECKDELISVLVNSSKFALDKNGEITTPSITTPTNSFVYEQFFIYSTLNTIALYSSGNIILSEIETNDFITSLDLKKPISTLLKKLFSCSTRSEIIVAMNEIFNSIDKTNVFLFLSYLKNSLYDYIKVSNGSISYSKKASLISKGNLKLSNPDKLYHQICSLSNNKTLNINSYKNDLILFFLEQN